MSEVLWKAYENLVWCILAVWFVVTLPYIRLSEAFSRRRFR